MENSTEVLIKLKIELPYDPAILLIGIYLEKNNNTNLKRYIHPNVYSITVYNSQDMEATQVSINRQIDKEDVVYINTMEYYLVIKIKFCHLQQCGWT